MNLWQKKKAQSAMEYLMTYGWAILIIAVVLGALFSLGVFSSSSFLGTACVPQSGFLCTNPILTTNTLTVTVGEATGQQWNTVTFFVVPTGSPTPSSPDGYPSNTVSPLYSGQQTTITMSNSGTNTILPSAIGTGFSGTIWAQYTPAGSPSSTLLAEIGTVTAKVA
ncbi:MAG: hypothetical protein ACP5T4_01975 [Candidatus Micrarchaeia archaeon]